MSKAKFVLYLTMLFGCISCANSNYKNLRAQGMTVDPDFKNLCLDVPFNNFMFAVTAPVLDMARATAKLPDGVVRRKTKIDFDGVKIAAEVYVRADEDSLSNRPCLFYLHGGGGGYKAMPYHAKLAAEYALEAHCVVIMPDYHRLPKATYPKPQEEMLAVYRWLLTNADSLGVDTMRIGVGGDSAGGYLAAMLCFNASEQGLTLPLCQMLLYPGLDSECSSFSARTFTTTPVWNARKNAKLWRDYNPLNRPREEISLLYRPIPEFVAPAYIETCEWDCLRDEGQMFAERLMFADVPVTLNATRGTVHAYDARLRASSIVVENLERRIAFLNSYFHPKK